MALRLEGIFTEIKLTTWMALALVTPATLFTFARLGLYRAIVRYAAEKVALSIIIGAAISATVLFLTTQYFALAVPRSVPLIYFSLVLLTTAGTRLFIRTIYLNSRDVSRSPVAIYGAGEAGRFMLRALQESKNYRPSLFIDDNAYLHGSDIAGTPILPLQLAREKIAADGVKTALIAISDTDLKGQRQAAAMMADLGLEVRMMPKVSDLISGRLKISSLRKVRIDELLGRDVVKPIPELMSRTIRGKSVMITGAGGSIGSELCRQILNQDPRRIILYEISEYALYTIVEDITATIAAQKLDIELIPKLGSVTNQATVEATIIQNNVDTIFHAAAFKHVPIVEVNAREAVRNNAFGTYITAHAAGRLGIKYFALISTDKAVRPTNIMGATKRLAEFTVSDAAMNYPNTKFCSVRFGNVLGSSGSVVPKFEKQILNGGPLTLTHPEITRYFMTIPEAAQLVIQASALADTGNIFLLDMGEPIRILDLARKMCALHSKRLFAGEKIAAPEGAIQLEITGLRPGEKLYEELLITGLEVNTIHPKIRYEPPSNVTGIDWKATIENILNMDSDLKIANALSDLPLEYKMDAIHTDPTIGASTNAITPSTV